MIVPRPWDPKWPSETRWHSVPYCRPKPATSLHPYRLGGRLLKTSSIEDITATGVFVTLRAADVERLVSIVERFPLTQAVRVDGEDVVVELERAELAALNEFVADNGVYLSHLSPRAVSLEEVFMDLTGAEHSGMGDVA